jgi:transposase
MIYLIGTPAGSILKLANARWRITHFLNWAGALVGDTPGLAPMRKALATLQNHIDRVVQRWTSTYTNARLEGFNGLFQAARARARGYRNTATFMTKNQFKSALT